MRVLVTGGAGYVGSHAAKLLAESGHEVVVVDNLAEGHRLAVGRLPIVVDDLLDRERLVSVMEENGIEAVMHFAALAYVGVSVREPAKYYQGNVVGTLSLLDAMRAAGVRLDDPLPEAEFRRRAANLDGAAAAACLGLCRAAEGYHRLRTAEEAPEVPMGGPSGHEAAPGTDRPLDRGECAAKDD